MRTITLYDPESGEFGAVISGHPDDMPNFAHFVDGSYDSRTSRFDLQSKKVVGKAPPPPQFFELRQRRNELLDNYRWTIMPDSPLSPACQEEWRVWLQALHSVLLDVTDTSAVAWPEMPGYEYASNVTE